MCGIVGYIGTREAVPLLLEGLKRLEYRGYDSSGLTVLTDAALKTHKAVGRISELEKTLPVNGEREMSHIGIAHTRWATHGAPTVANAHPHIAMRFAVGKNGIIGTRHTA